MHEDQSLLERIKLSRSKSELSQPTDEPQAVNVSEDAPVEEEVETEVITNDDTENKIEDEAEEVGTDEVNEEETDLFYYEIDGEEVSSEQLKEWKSDGLKQADYTRKTQEHAKNVESFNEMKQEFEIKESKMAEKLATLEAMISEETLSDADIAEMREYEPEEYIKYTEKLSKRKEFLDKNKVVKSNFDVESERAKLWDANPAWLDNGKQTKQFDDDMKSIQAYATEKGYTNDDLSNFRAQDFQTLLHASKYQELLNKNTAIEKKVRKAPVSTRPKANSKRIDGDLEKAQKAFKANPNDKNAVALRKIKRQLNSKR